VLAAGQPLYTGAMAPSLSREPPAVLYASSTCVCCDSWTSFRRLIPPNWRSLAISVHFVDNINNRSGRSVRVCRTLARRPTVLLFYRSARFRRTVVVICAQQLCCDNEMLRMRDTHYTSLVHLSPRNRPDVADTPRDVQI